MGGVSFHAPSILCRDEKLEFSHIMRVPTTWFTRRKRRERSLKIASSPQITKSKSKTKNLITIGISNRHTIADYGSDGSKPHDPDRFTGEG